jgi:YidC/Oxa1 family membrane protein insertase
MMVVMVGVIVGLQVWRARQAPTVPASAPAATTSAPSAQPAAGSAHANGASQALPAHTEATPAIVAAAEATTVVENQLYRITFSNRGGQVTSWVLKNYRDEDGKPLDLVDHAAAEKYGSPLSLYTYDEALTQQLATALYVVTPAAGGTVQTPATLHFDYASGDIAVHKTFSFSDGYLVHADAVVLRDGFPVRALIAWPSGLGDLEKPRTHIGRSSYSGDSVVDTLAAGKEEHEASKKVSGGATLDGPFDFAGVSDQYFAATFLPDQPQGATVVTLHHQIDLAEILKAKGLPAKSTAYIPVIGAAVGSTSGYDAVNLFVGPKNIDLLKSIHTASGSSLEPILDFGFWGPIGKFLFLGLRAVHSILPNAGDPTSVARNFSWGWAIVLFTVFINLLLLPLRIQGMRSMLKMQRIQPQLDAIKAKYKNPKPTDPRMAEMNAEIMATQKANGVSMFGGCIPSLIQLPLLLAFFTMMTKVVELRQAHFFWLPDLSSADPYHILPIFMVITSFLVQFYTPSPGVDPQQQKMMAFMMPAFSGYMTWSYAAGLGLYWNVGNLIMIAQQAIMNRTSMGREMREIQAKRASRKAAIPAAKAGPRPPVKTIQGRR